MIRECYLYVVILMSEMFVSLFSQTPMKQHKDCNFSYAGLKTQVRLAIESRNMYVGNIEICIWLLLVMSS